MQWMTVTSLVPCHALHVPQHVAVSLSEPLNQVISSAPSTERYKQAKIRKRRNQKKIPTPKTEVGKNQTNNQVLIP